MMNVSFSSWFLIVVATSSLSVWGHDDIIIKRSLTKRALVAQQIAFVDRQEVEQSAFITAADDANDEDRGRLRHRSAGSSSSNRGLAEQQPSSHHRPLALYDAVASHNNNNNAHEQQQQQQQRFLQSEDVQIECDNAFLQCLTEDGCVECFLELQMNDIDWATVHKDTPCNSVISFLKAKQHCVNVADSESSRRTFCSTFSSCVNWDEMDNGGGSADNPDTKIDCATLTKCDWAGFHPGYLGDGTCQEGLDCYNTAICGWDGGDCCQDTCEQHEKEKAAKEADRINTNGTVTPKDKYYECGHDGYYCKDTTSANCDSTFTNQCTNGGGSGDKDDFVDPSTLDCQSGTTPFRLIMYDSFGDGWDATKITIRDSAAGQNTSPIFQGSLSNGAQGTQYMCLAATDANKCYHVDVTGGVWGNEVSWEVKPLVHGAPAIAGGGAPMACDFSVVTGGNTCEHTCSGKANKSKNDDPEYKKFKDMYSCLEKQCPIQVGACEKDPICTECFVDDAPEYCFAVDDFNAVVDCTLCQCTENKGSQFCAQKANPGMVVPSNDNNTPQPDKPCSPQEIMAGSAAVMEFAKCSAFDEVGITITEFDQNNFGALDVFELCAHEFQQKEDHGGHTALDCLRILVSAMNGDHKYDKDSNGKTVEPSDAIKAMAKLLYTDGEGFCDCAYDASEKAPLCPGFKRFKTLLYESLDACQALDEIDCDAWNEFHMPCQNNLQTKYGQIDFNQEDVCNYVREGCGDAGPYPSFRHLDCDTEIPSQAWDFYTQFAKGCLNGQQVSPYTPVEPVDPVPTPPTPNPPAPAPDGGDTSPSKQYIPPEERGQPSGSSSDKSYVPPEDKKSGRKRRSGRWFWNLVWFSMLGGVAFVVYKRRQDGFSFIRYRRMRTNWGGDTDVYSGLSMESSTSFEPPSLPPRPTFMGGNSGMNDGGGGGGYNMAPVTNMT